MIGRQSTTHEIFISTRTKAQLSFFLRRYLLFPNIVLWLPLLFAGTFIFARIGVARPLKVTTATWKKLAQKWQAYHACLVVLFFAPQPHPQNLGLGWLFSHSFLYPWKTGEKNTFSCVTATIFALAVHVCCCLWGKMCRLLNDFFFTRSAYVGLFCSFANRGNCNLGLFFMNTSHAISAKWFNVSTLTF